MSALAIVRIRRCTMPRVIPAARTPPSATDPTVLAAVHVRCTPDMEPPYPTRLAQAVNTRRSSDARRLPCIL